MRLTLLCVALFSATSAMAATFPTSWTAVRYTTADGGVEFLGDDDTDGQTDYREVVGNNATPAFYVASDTTDFFFRIRLESSPLQSANNLRPFGWGILIDTDGIYSDYDYIVMINGVAGRIEYRANTTKTQSGDPGDTAETSLANINLVWAGAGTNVRVVSAGSALGNPQAPPGTNFFLDVAIPLAVLYGTNPDGGAYLNFPPTQALGFWVGVSNSANNIQTDLGGFLGSPGAGSLQPSVSQPVSLCSLDSQCGSVTSGSICVTGVCTSGCRGTGGNGCPSGSTCSSVDATPGTCSLPPPPPAPVVMTPVNGVSTNDSTPTVSGTAQASSTVRVYLDGSGTATCTTTASAGGTWSCDVSSALGAGSHSVRATATNLGGTSAQSNTNTFTVDVTAPAVPVITSPINGSSTNDTTPTVSGTAEANSTVRVFVNGSLTPSCTTTATAGGSWVCELSALAAGSTYSLTARATDAASNVSAASAGVNITIDTQVPAAPVVSAPAHNSFVNTASPTITGTAEANSSVNVSIDGSSVGTTTANSSGIWSLALSVSIAAGQHQVFATATDAASNTSAQSNTNTFTVDVTPPSAPVVSAPAHNSFINTASPTITGTAEANSSVNVSIDGSSVGITTADGSGNWSFAVSSSLSAGPHQVFATATDAASNTSAQSNTNTFTVDVTPPSAPVVSAPAHNSFINTASPTITGTAEANSTLTISVDGNVLGTTTADGSGNWSFAVSSSLSAGPHQVFATARDAAGNTSVASNANTFTVDLTPPVVPVIDAPSAGATLADSTPTVSGTAEANSTVRVFVDGSLTPSCTTTATAGGTWTCDLSPALNDGAYTLTATATDAASNASAASAGVSITIDTQAPVVPVIDAPSAGATLADSTPTVSGTAEANSTVKVFVDGSLTPSCTTTATAGGTWTCDLSPALNDGAHTLTATATDAASNVSAASAGVSITIDTQAPVVPVIDAPSAGATLADSTPTVSGTAEANSTVKVFVDGSLTPSCTTTATAGGTWTCDLSPALNDGAHTLTATATDAASNVSAASAGVSITIDTQAPSAPVISQPASGSTTADNTPAITGTAEAGSTVTVFIDGASLALCTVIADMGGSWSCTPSTALTDGPHSLIARATDTAGGVSVPTGSTFTVDTTAPGAPQLLGPLQASTTSPTPTFSGEAEPGSTVRVFVDGSSTPACTAVASATGNFACVATLPLNAGAHTANCFATDATGNTSTASNTRDFTVGATQPPDPPVITVPVSGSATADTTPTLVGTSAPGATVRVYVDAGVTPVCSATADASGVWACDVMPALASGTYTIVATASTPQGISGPSAPVQFDVDASAPAAPSITAPATNEVTGLRPLVFGTAEPGSTVAVYFDGSVTPACTAIVDAQGNWACAPILALSVGAHSVTAKATDPAGNEGPASAPVSFSTSASQPPVAPLITEPIAGEHVASATPIFSGISVPLSTVEVFIDGSNTPACTTTADASGRFACASATPLTDGPHTVAAKATDSTGTSPLSTSVPFNIDTQAPATPTIASPAANANTGRTPTLSGTAVAGSIVVVRIDGQVVCETVATPQGMWSCPVTQPLQPGAHDATATSVDEAGNRSAPSSSLPFTVLGEPRVPTLQQPSSGGQTTDTTPTYVGVAEPNSQISVKVNGTVVCTTTADAMGAFSCTPTVPLALGNHSVEVTSTTAGGTATSAMTMFSVIEASPAAPTLTSPSPGQRTSDTTPTFSGSAQPGTTVRIFVDGTEVCSALVDTQGRFSCTGTAPLSVGDHVVTATATGAGGTSLVSMGVAFTVFSPPTELPTVITPPAGGIVTQRPTFTGTATPGSTVQVFVGGKEVCSTTAGADGSWVCTPDEPLPEGDWVATVVSTDADGTMRESAERPFHIPVRSLQGAGFGCSASGESSWALWALGLMVLVWRKRRVAPAVVAAVVLTSPLVFAQATAVPGFELEQLRLNAGARHGLLVDSADLLEANRFRAALSLHYQHDPLVLYVDGKRSGSVVGGRLGAHLSGAYGITDWLEVGLQFPLVLFQTGQDLSVHGLQPVTNAVSLGTSWLSVRGAPIQQSRGSVFDFALGLGLGIPLGTSETLTSNKGISLAPSVSIGRTFSRDEGDGPSEFLRVGASVHYQWRPRQPLTPTATAFTDEVGQGLSIGLLVANVSQGLRAEISGRIDVPLTRTAVGGEVWLGVRYPLFNLFEVYAVGGPGFGQQPGTPTFRVLGGFAFAPTRSAEPRCRAGQPHAPGMCPDLDDDADGVRNADDACVNTAGLAERNGCPDIDGDGVLDGTDRCPTVQGPAANDGCPPDDDADGVANAEDACQAAPGPKPHGCPDSDGDGLHDGVDKCPSEPGLAEFGGCKPPDGDGDGVADNVDACLSEKGPASNQGCPANKTQLVEITKDRLVILDKVYFATGKSTVLAKSFTLLDQIARILREHSEVKTIAIEGHTDDRGSRALNMKLSQSRAESVREYLIGHGVAAERLKAAGYGPDRPVQPNTTSGGRDANRRVDFVIVGDEKANPTPAP